MPSATLICAAASLAPWLITFPKNDPCPVTASSMPAERVTPAPPSLPPGPKMSFSRWLTLLSTLLVSIEVDGARVVGAAGGQQCHAPQDCSAAQEATTGDVDGREAQAARDVRQLATVAHECSSDGAISAMCDGWRCVVWWCGGPEKEDAGSCPA